MPFWHRGFCAFKIALVLMAAAACGSEAPAAPAPPPIPHGLDEVTWGEWLYAHHGCAGCHSLAGRTGVGPALDDVAGQMRPIEGGEALADTSYLRAALLEPTEHVTRGYAPMPVQSLTHAQVDALVAYLQHLAGVSAER